MLAHGFPISTTLAELVCVEPYKWNVAITDAYKVSADGAIAVDPSRVMTRDRHQHAIELEGKRDIRETLAIDAAG